MPKTETKERLIEYLFTVRALIPGKPRNLRSSWEVKEVRALGMKGVALELKRELNDVIYIHKDRII